MSAERSSIIVNNVKLPINASFEEAFSVARDKLKKLKIKTVNPEYRIAKRSIDARRKDDILFVYSVCVSGVVSMPSDIFLKDNGLTAFENQKIKVVYGNESSSSPPLVVGSGPCGMFCALLLAEHGYKPTLIERGGSVAERKLAVERLNKFGILDKDTNIQFGAGGAGTFSDGKLITRINDPMSTYVLEKLVEFGAPEDILYNARPHIGTDILSTVVDKILTKVESLGGRVMYHTALVGINTDTQGRVISVSTDGGDLKCGALILAVGHSARDTYSYLIKSGFHIEAKPFSVGMRIEHLASDIDKSLYGELVGHPSLPHAEYNLSHNTKERGVYTFCMCPGGEVVAAASEECGTVVNGMSRHNRDGVNSNSAVVCSIFRDDYGATPYAAIEFQRKIERAAYQAAGGEYSAPIITVGDFLEGRLKKEPSRILPTYRGGTVKLASPESYLPKFVCDGIRNAICAFDKRIKGFSTSDAVLTGAETRTSAPIRILRNNETRLAIGYDNLYPAGEGAGYAGGITSAAIDGLKTALAVMSRYKPI